MKVIKTGGAEITLGTAQAAPTISMTDYSRRVTDDYGVTTVVKRGFARKMAVRFALPFDDVSRVQSELADLRGSAARWEVDADVDWLNFEGFYKDFDIDHAVPPLSFCSLTVEGLAEVEPGTDDGSDPAADGVSTLLVLQPTEIVGFLSHNVPENDYPEWASGTSYALGARAIKAATHRIYESVASSNIGNDPAGESGLWIDIGPTNRWAMFDQALGTSTTQASSIIFSVAPGDVRAIALLDVVAASVRIQKPGYDQTRSASTGSVNFFDIPGGGGALTITISGSGTLSVGTILFGKLAGLGNSGESPTAGITDYSRKEVDDFGDTTIVERAWAKRMTTKALIKNASIDIVCNRMAALRGKPVLWVADDGTDSLTIYGFYKDFSIEVGDSVSPLSLSIEGLSKSVPAVVAADILTVSEKQSFILVEAARDFEIDYLAVRVASIDTVAVDALAAAVDVAKTNWLAHRNAISPAWDDVTLPSPRVWWAWQALNNALDAAISALRRGISEEDALRAQIAGSDATSAQLQIANIVADDILDKSEKPYTVERYVKLLNEQAGIDTQAAAFAITTERTAYNAAVTALTAYLTGLAPAYNSYTTDTPIVRAAHIAKFNDVDLARQLLLNKIAAISKLQADLGVANAAAAQATANAAESAASSANASAAAANAALADIASDSLLTPDEKPRVVQDRDDILAEQSGIETAATNLGITTEKTAYTNAIAALTSYLATLTTPVLWSNLSGNTGIVGAAFRNKFLDVYAARQTLLNKTLEIAAQRANWPNVTGTGRPDDNATVSDNFIKNADLSQGIIFWSFNPANTSRQTGIAGVANEPPYYWRMTSTSADIRANAGALIPVAGGSRLYLSFSGRCAGGTSGYFQFTIWEYDNAGGLIGTIPIYVTPAGTAWESRSTAVTLNANTARILLQTGCGASIGAFADIGAFRLSNTERNASVPVQVSIVGGQDKTIAADYLGAVTGSYPVFAPTVLRNGVSIKTDTYTTYAVTKVSNGTTGADGGTISLDNTGGSTSKGNVTPSAFATGSTQIKWQLETKVNGVTVDRTVCTLTKSLADPPASGGGSGGGGGGGATSASMPANATISSNTTYAALSSSPAQKITIATGQTLRCTLVTEYNAGTSSGGRALTAKARYANNSGMTSPTDFGSAVTGTDAYPGAVAGGDWLDPVAGSLTFTQTVTGLAAGDYWVDMQGITTVSGKPIVLFGQNIIIEVH